MAADNEEKKLNNKTDVNLYFAKFVNLVDDNIRLVQYGIYTIGGIGLLIVMKNSKLFTKFTSASKIPKKFIQENATFSGIVQGIHTDVVPVANATIAKSRSNKSLFSSIRRLSAVSSPKLDLKSRVSLPQNLELCSLFLKVDHTPFFPIFGRFSTNNYLSLRVSSIESYPFHTFGIKEDLEGRNIKLTLLDYNKDKNYIEAIIQNGNTMNYNKSLVQSGRAVVGPFRADLKGSKTYLKFYKNLLTAEKAAQRNPSGIWRYGHKEPWYQSIFLRLMSLWPKRTQTL